jgi:hypothetical protein
LDGAYAPRAMPGAHKKRQELSTPVFHKMLAVIGFYLISGMLSLHFLHTGN